MIAFLRKADRADLLPHVHAGWVSALMAGGLTWFMATYVVSISGADREVTEGLSSLFAAAVLLGEPLELAVHAEAAAAASLPPVLLGGQVVPRRRRVQQALQRACQRPAGRRGAAAERGPAAHAWAHS